MKQNIYSKTLNIVVILGIAITCILLFGTPLIVTAFYKVILAPKSTVLVLSTSACIYICAIPYLIALFKLQKICSSIVKEIPFSKQNVKLLKIIAICAFSECVTFIASLVYLKSSFELFQYTVYGGPVIVIVFISITIGLFCLVLSELLNSAIIAKEENEFTI